MDELHEISVAGARHGVNGINACVDEEAAEEQRRKREREEREEQRIIQAQPLQVQDLEAIEVHETIHIWYDFS